MIMAWRFCLEFPSVSPFRRKKICFEIPTLVRKFPDIDPGPWITEDIIDEKIARDLPVLATLDALASQLSNAKIKKAVQSAIQSAVDPKSLPENMRIEFK
jgi:hypothetical protein